MMLPTGPRLYDALVAALDTSGPAILPLSPELPSERVRALLETLRPTALVTPNGTTPVTDGVPVADETAVVIATSGSTGEPKGVALTGNALVHSARATLTRLRARPGDRWLACLPTSHIAGVQVLVRSIAAGVPPVMHERFDVEAVRASDAAFVAVVPTMLGRLLDAGVDVSRFRAVLLGGAAPSPRLLDRARSAGAGVVTTYGMTETCGGCVYDGRQLRGVEVDLDGDGRIRLAGPVLFSGYRLRPDLTAEAMDGRWLVTRDLGAWDDGRLRVLGRVDDVIITGGRNVVPEKIATLLAGHPKVRDAVVVGRPDPEWGQRVTAVVVPSDRYAPPTLDELRAYVRPHAPSYAAPRELDVVETIPLLPSGKPDRAALRRGNT